MATDADTAQRFPDMHRGTLRSAFEGGGVAGVMSFVDGFADPAEKVKLWALATRVASQELRPRDPFKPETAPAKWLNLDELTAIYDAAIGAALAEMERAPTPEQAGEFKQSANVLSFNLCADLAPCWPDDNELREPRHYAAGVAAARRAVRYRIELNKKAENFALAYWALGVHQLGSGALADAVESFKLSMEHSRIAAEEYGRKAEVSGQGDWSFILNCGYLGIARALLNEPDGMAQYRASLEAYRLMAEEQPEMGEDARFGSAQLEKTAQLFGAERRP